MPVQSTPGPAAWAGFDPEILHQQSTPHRLRFECIGMSSLFATGLAGVSCSAWITAAMSSRVLGLVVGSGFALLTLNLYRLVHASSTMAAHLDGNGLATWRPSAAGPAFFGLFGLIVAIPLVVWLHGSGSTDPMAVRLYSAWQTPFSFLATYPLLVTVFVAPSILRLVWIDTTRLYQAAHHVRDRAMVLREWTETTSAIEQTLSESSGATIPFASPYADPPFNTRLLILGQHKGTVVVGQTSQLIQSLPRL